MKAFGIFASLLLAATFAVAADHPASTAPQASTKHQEFQGCVSGTTGNFKLVEPSGEQVQLQGNDSLLARRSGHEIRVYGTTAKTDPVVSVSSVEDLSASCNLDNKTTAPASYGATPYTN